MGAVVTAAVVSGGASVVGTVIGSVVGRVGTGFAEQPQSPKTAKRANTKDSNFISSYLET